MGLIKQLFWSKKFLVSLSGMVFVLLSKLGVPIDEETVSNIVIILAAYVVGQGLADTGKEALKDT